MFYPALKPESFKKLHEPAGQYVCGWAVVNRPWAGGVALTHAGSNTLWMCTIWLAPEKNFALLIATNRAGGKTPEALDQAAGKLMEFMKDRKPD
jgi:hypothetical protein